MVREKTHRLLKVRQPKEARPWAAFLQPPDFRAGAQNLVFNREAECVPQERSLPVDGAPQFHLGKPGLNVSVNDARSHSTCLGVPEVVPYGFQMSLELGERLSAVQFVIRL